MNILSKYTKVTKQDVLDLADSISKEVLDGNASAIETAAKIKFLTDALESAKEKIKSFVIEEASKYDKNESITTLGFYRVEVKEMGTKYDFSQCNHPKWNELQSEIERLREEQKQVETFLKGLKASMSIASEDTDGEIVTVYPPIKTLTTSAVFTIAK